MDGRGFDALARELASGTSRRRVLKQLLGGVGGGVVALAGVTGALGQQCRLAGRLCNKNANCCSNLCDTGNPDPFLKNRCICPGGTVECRGECLIDPDDFQDDPNNCGGCGNVCQPATAGRQVLNADAICCDGVCDYACVAGYQQCGVGCFAIGTFPITTAVPSTTGFVSTGLALLPGDSVLIGATGSLQLSAGHAVNGPNGNTTQTDPNFCGPGIAGGAAMFRIGSQVGFVGTGPSVATAAVAGTLEVGICDCAGCFGDNLGPGFNFTVNCNVTPTGCNPIIG